VDAADVEAPVIATFRRWGWYVYGALFLDLFGPWRVFTIRHYRGPGQPRGLIAGHLGPFYGELGWVK
jgi:hypothetical protein